MEGEKRLSRLGAGMPEPEGLHVREGSFLSAIFLVRLPSVQAVRAIPPTVMPAFVKFRFSAANRIKDE